MKKIVCKIGPGLEDALFFSAFALCLGFLLWKAPRGFGFNDEPFIISTAHRLLFGDGLLADEWNPAQLIGFIIYPFVLLYHKLSGGMEGAILFFRYCYVGIWSATALFAYSKLKAYPLAWAAILFFYLYAPLDYMTLSYNSIALSSLLTAFIIMLFSKRKPAFVIAGILFSFVVLLYPFMIFIYICYTVAVFYTRKQSDKPDCLAIKNWLLMSIGSAIIAAIFVIVLFSRASINDIQLSFEWLTYGTSTFSSRNPIRKAWRYLLLLYETFPVQFITSLIVWVISIIDRGRAKREYIYISLMSLAFFVSLYASISDMWGKFNYIMAPFACVGLQFFILTKKKNWKVFMLFVIGIYFSYILLYFSDTLIMAVCHGLSLSSFAGILFAGEWLAEKKSQTNKQHCPFRFLLCGVLLLCLLQIGGLFAVRWQRNYWDAFTPMLTTRITSGVYKGIYTTPQNADHYYAQTGRIAELNMMPSEKFFFNELLPWLYLEADREYSVFSTWFNLHIVPEKTALKQIAYWEAKPDKLPDCALLWDNGTITPDVFANFADMSEYQVTECDGYWIIRRIR